MVDGVSRDGEPRILDQVPEYSAAIGVAELAKRVSSRQMRELDMLADGIY